MGGVDSVREGGKLLTAGELMDGNGSFTQDSDLRLRECPTFGRKGRES
jgi:hypothetical protein